MTQVVEVQGFCKPQFAAVKEAFTDNFASHGEAGAGFSLYYSGEKVVELRGERQRPCRFGLAADQYRNLSPVLLTSLQFK